MKMIALAAVGGLAVATATAGTVTAFNLTAATDPAVTVVTANVLNHPDSAHGTPDIWARDTFKVRVEIRMDSPGNYTITTVDHGTFKTVMPCATCSPNAGAAIKHQVTGAFDGTEHGSAVGTLKSAADIVALNGKPIDDTAAVDKAGSKFHSDTWFLQFFQPGATGSASSTHYAFKYKTADEQYVQTTENDTKNSPTGGDITGKLSSHLTAKNKCRIKGTNHNRWSVTNDRGDRSRGFVYRVGYKGKWSATANGTVAAGKTYTFTTPTGGYLSVLYWDGYRKAIYTSAQSKYDTVC